MLMEIIEEAEEFKIDFYRRRTVTIGNNKAANREKEKVSGHNSVLRIVIEIMWYMLGWENPKFKLK